MKWTLKKDLPLAKAWTKIELWTQSINSDTIPMFPVEWDEVSSSRRCLWMIFEKDIHEWIDIIVEKKTYDDLMVCDKIYFIDSYWEVDTEKFTTNNCRAETFLTREEAEDEHKRREWAVRKNKFFPKEWELYYTQWRDTGDIEKFKMTNDYIDNFIINSWLAFRSESECQDAIDNHDIIRLFYDVR